MASRIRELIRNAFDCCESRDGSVDGLVLHIGDAKGSDFEFIGHGYDGFELPSEEIC